MRYRNGEAGYFVVLDETGEEIVESRVRVPEGFDREGDQWVVNRLLATKGEGCEIVFRPEDRFR